MDGPGEGGEDGERMRVEKVKTTTLNYAMLDAAFTESPNQSEPVTCKELEELFDWRRKMSVREAGKYKCGRKWLVRLIQAALDDQHAHLQIHGPPRLWYGSLYIELAETSYIWNSTDWLTIDYRYQTLERRG
ncbi:hypothetical protein K503DRAFT_606543 [Rhizopogon vinicolor AM-OR11-026]|uniref:Uncharacterized protein n=1 Tax=Rhizopogon vinicolor AM-OR11-026 TaxID=1314800 RepID=A0A1B7MIL4_9AGAM|nr:hypothetical protein K503DRAFT_606543 [Rhizopogon vinicolor AM-OR11-026]